MKDFKDWNYTEQRIFVDEVLGKTETRKEREDEIIAMFGKKDYHELLSGQQDILNKFLNMTLKRDMTIIQITAQELIKKEASEGKK